MKAKYIFTAVALSSVLAGCSLHSDKDGSLKEKRENIRAIIEAERAEDRSLTAPVALKPTTKLKKLKIPRSAPWLANSVSIKYKGIPASKAISLVSQDYPVSYDFTVTGELDAAVDYPVHAVTLLDHLSSICRQADWTFRVDNGVIVISDIETKTLLLSVQPGVGSSAMRLNNLGSILVQESSGGNSGARNDVTLELDPYGDELLEMAEGVLGISDDSHNSNDTVETGDGVVEEVAQTIEKSTQSLADPRTSVSILSSGNMMVVTAKPSKIRALERVLDSFNAQASRSVRLEIAIFGVDTIDSEDRSLTLDIVRAAAITGEAVVPGSINADSGSLSFSFNDGSRFDGSSAVFGWLQRAGNTAVIFSDTIEVTNNQIASVDATRNERYISEVTRENIISGNSESDTPEVNFDNLRTGSAIHMQPTIIGDEVTVRLRISRASVIEEVPFSFDEGRIAGTNFVTDDFNRAVSLSLKDGESKLVSSLSSTEIIDSKQRTPWLPFLGDTVNGSEVNRELVLLVSATLL